MSESATALRKRVKELRGEMITASLSSAGVDQLKKEIAYHESAMKSAERDKKRGEALARARESKVLKSRSKKDEVEQIKEHMMKEKPVKKVEKPVEKEVMSKYIRTKRVKDADES